MATLHNIKTVDDAIAAMRAVDGYQRNTTYPQHKALGKKSGGLATVGGPCGVTVHVWNTKTGWHGEIVCEGAGE